MVICADVIEHVRNPDVIMGRILRAGPKHIVISTPDVSLIGLDTEDGPPKNLHHVREWNFDQFRAYLDDHFEVESHYVCNPEQYAQVAVCRIR